MTICVEIAFKGANCINIIGKQLIDTESLSGPVHIV